MGFSPGEFRDDRDRDLHWEGKGSGEVILWNADESEIILRLTEDQASKCANQLNLLVDMALTDSL